MDNAAVSRHYNERRDEGKRGRKASRIIRMRSFNNWVKSVLINLHTRPGYSVLDLCCGKGGDLTKWAKAKCAEYVACDTAAVSIQQVGSASFPHFSVMRAKKHTYPRQRLSTIPIGNIEVC